MSTVPKGQGNALPRPHEALIIEDKPIRENMKKRNNKQIKLPFWAAAPKGPMTYAFTYAEISPSLFSPSSYLLPLSLKA